MSEMNDDISKRPMAVPRRRLNRSTSNLSASEPKVPNPLSGFSFNMAGDNSIQQQQQQQQQQQPLFNMKTPSPQQQAPVFSAKATTNSPPVFSFGGGGGNNLPFTPPTNTSPPTAVGFGNKPPTSASPFGNTPVAAPVFGGGAINANKPSAPIFTTPTTTPTSTPFGGANVATSSAPSMFGTNTTSSPFGAPSTPEKKPTTTIPSFGTNTPSSVAPPTFSIAASTPPSTATSTSPFSFSTNATTSKPPSSTAFSFNAPPQATTTPTQFSFTQKENKPLFGAEKADKESSDKKENIPLFGTDGKDNKKDEKAATPGFSFNAPKKDDGIFGKPTTPVFGTMNTNKKREHSDEVIEPSTKKTMFSTPLTTIEEKKKDNTVDSSDKKKEDEVKKDDKAEPKKVRFNLSSSDSSKKETGEQPSVSLAFSTKQGSSEGDSTTLKVSAANSDTVIPAPIKCNITDPSQITKKTFFYELPEVAQRELAEFSHFITSQAEKLDKAALDTEFTIGSRVRAMKTESTSLNNDAEITLKQLGYLNEKANDLIQKNNTHRVNITAALLLQQQDVKHWRLRGAAENWSYFKDIVDNTQKRLDSYKESINSIEENVMTMQTNAAFTPAKVGSVIESQGKILLSLAGRVAEVHEQVERITLKKP